MVVVKYTDTECHYGQNTQESSKTIVKSQKSYNINKLAEDNWEKFTTDDYTPLQGHLLKYLIKVDSDGKVSSLHEHEHFPDVGGKVPCSQIPDQICTIKKCFS